MVSPNNADKPPNTWSGRGPGSWDAQSWATLQADAERLMSIALEHDGGYAATIAIALEFVCGILADRNDPAPNALRVHLEGLASYLHPREGDPQ